MKRSFNFQSKLKILFGNFHQRENMFQTKVIMKITEEAPEIKVPSRETSDTIKQADEA